MKKNVAVFFTVILLAAAVYYFYNLTRGNFYVVTPNEAYRSAQLDKKQLEYYINKYHIKSILNLRDENYEKNWYTDEVQICKKDNVMFYNIPLLSVRAPSQDAVKELMKVFKAAPRPVLIHCKSGADRTGLVSAMWKISVDKEPRTKALRQLSLKYFHVPVGKTSTLDQFFKGWDPEN